MNKSVGSILGLERCSTCNKLALRQETISVPVSEYEALKAAADSSVQRKKIASYRAISGSKIAKNPEMAEFIIECAASMTVSEVREACKERFGAATPSWSSIFRFLDAMKRGGK
ncbi:hypothetical protein D4A92_21505 [Rhizobium rosettiformans]|uniref:Uncharacterized protein n=1 Tax=Rhizobium rosettiformans TaxID=1368430 RepID=A0ABX7F0I2_9HYPH|nr:hypothetical protein [Rhizobium rosettiformans]QRF53842.1 hypothetical protein D4A92_21505 [Rhizobium rosettiformans]